MKRLILAVAGTIAGLIALLSFRTHAGPAAAGSLPGCPGYAGPARRPVRRSRAQRLGRARVRVPVRGWPSARARPPSRRQACWRGWWRQMLSGGIDVTAMIGDVSPRALDGATPGPRPSGPVLKPSHKSIDQRK